MLLHRNLYEEMRRNNPKRNPIFNAVDELDSKEDIGKFFNDYVDFLEDENETNPRDLAGMNLGYVLGYYSSTTFNKWAELLPEIKNPYFGRNIPELSNSE
jgi:hypothetical protein